MVMLPDTPDVRSRIDVLYLVTREFNAGLDIDEILKRVLAATVASVGASDASLFLFNEAGELENYYLIHGFEMQERSRETMETIHRQGLTAWVKEHREAALIRDTSLDKRWFQDDNNNELNKIGSAVSVPIQLPDQLLGVLTITAIEPNYFDESNQAMLSIIADQAAFAIANARLFKAEQHRRSLADTLASIAHTINSTLDLKEVLQLILEQLILVIEYDSCSIFLLDKEKEMLIASAAHGFEKNIKEDALGMHLPMNRNLPNYRVIAEKKPVVIADIDTEPGWVKRSSSDKIRSWMGVPLITRDQVIGMLTIDSYEVNKYSEENANDISAFADQAATAVANAQTFSHLRDTEASYIALFENNTDMILITNYQGDILNMNTKACQALWMGKTDFFGNEISSIDEKLSDDLASHQEELKDSQEILLELEALDALQQKLALEFKARQVHYQGKDCVQWVGRDISARKEAEQLREDLVKMLVHDLRGPLANLVNIIDLLPRLIESTENNPALEEVLGAADRSSQQLRDLIDSMLDVSREQQGSVPLKRYEVRLETVMAAAKEQVMPRANAKQMEMIFSPLPKLPLLWVDESMIRRVLVNLIDNAVKYTQEKGTVTVSASRKNNTLYLSVSDNGPGISKENQARIFKKFSRIDSSSRAPSGVGLGLAFCKLAAEAHGGSISVESDGIPGKGSTFLVTIPIEMPPDIR